MKAPHPIPESGGRWSRDPKTGELSPLPDEDDAAEPEAEKPAAKPPASPDSKKG